MPAPTGPAASPRIPQWPAKRPSPHHPTVAGTHWFLILRLYGPLVPWFDRTWVPGDVSPL